MSHFYRLYTINDFTGKKCGIGVADTYRPSGKTGSLPPEYWRAMEEIPLDPPWPHCKMLRAPLMPEEYKQEHYIFNLRPGVELPDVWAWGTRALVSERAKTVLESCDDFGHEYIETEIQDKNRQRINKAPYYLLSVRRILQIDELGGTIENRHKMFCPDYMEEKILPVVQQNSDLKEKLSQLPLWRQDRNVSVIYISETVLEKLREANITGLNLYTTYDGKPGESLARFE
jgi:hypothetical protein